MVVVVAGAGCTATDAKALLDALQSEKPLEGWEWGAALCAEGAAGGAAASAPGPAYIIYTL